MSVGWSTKNKDARSDYLTLTESGRARLFRFQLSCNKKRHLGLVKKKGK